MNKIGLYLIPAAALFFAFIPIAFIHLIAWLTYKHAPWLSESQSWTFSLVGLFLLGLTAMALGGAGSYFLLSRTRPLVAVPVIILCCIPALVAGAVYLRAVLVFLAIA
jgi:phosphoglycerol transferase MdoB-like AlkP superfamily enzyme